MMNVKEIQLIVLAERADEVPRSHAPPVDQGEIEVAGNHEDLFRKSWGVRLAEMTDMPRAIAEPRAEIIPKAPPPGPAHQRTPATDIPINPAQQGNRWTAEGRREK